MGLKGQIVLLWTKKVKGTTVIEHRKELPVGGQCRGLLWSKCAGYGIKRPDTFSLIYLKRKDMTPEFFKWLQTDVYPTMKDETYG